MLEVTLMQQNTLFWEYVGGGQSKHSKMDRLPKSQHKKEVSQSNHGNR